MIGTFGKNIVFEVSEEKVSTFNGMTREVAGRWAVHETPGTKPRAEFLGAGLSTITLPISLSATLGVKPREVLQAIEDMVESGSAEYLVIGNAPVGANPYRVTGGSETWDRLYSGGELVRATVSITLEEYT